MITKFTTVYAVTSISPTAGTAPRPTSSTIRTSGWGVSSRRPRRSPRRWTALGFDTLWLAERHFRHEGYEHSK